MFVRIENSSGMPITRQVMDQIRAHIGSGVLAPGDRLPGVRVLAHELAINQNTVLRVYERLTMEGLLERKHGDGTFVAQRVPPARLLAETNLICQQIEELARRALEFGAEPQQLRDAVDRAVTPKEEAEPTTS